MITNYCIALYIITQHLFFLTFLFIYLYLFISQLLKNIDVSNIDYKSAYYYDLWISCDTEDCSNDAENTAASQK